MKGYKVFRPDWICRGFQYAVGGTFEENVTPSCCNKGFHFCTELKDCFNYYSFDPNNKVAEIEAIGEIDAEVDGSKHCTNKIKIVREISWEEVLKMVNMGKVNAGLCNSGDCNSGDWNSGNRNCGDWNSGNRNSGNRNSGNRNSGNRNSGNRNSGDWNSGNRNSGDWNKTNFSGGCFNTKESKILMFNKPSDWTFRDWQNSKARYLLNKIQHNVLEWIYSDNMTDEEKEQYPEYKTTGGYLKELDESKCAQIWWDNLSFSEKKIIEALPNFDAEIFKEITGIDINKGV